MTSKIFIDSLEIDTVIGLHQWEKQVIQKIIADIEISLDFSRAAAIDDISLSLDYEEITIKLRSWAQNHSCELMEKLATAMTAQIKSMNPNISKIKLKLTKKGVVPYTVGCGVMLEVNYNE